MINPYRPPAEILEPSKPRQPDTRSPLTVIDAIVLSIISFYLVLTESMVEGFGAFVISMACQAIGKKR